MKKILCCQCDKKEHKVEEEHESKLNSSEINGPSETECKNKLC